MKEFSEKIINEIFIPLLKNLNEIYEQSGGRKIIAYLVSSSVERKMIAECLEKISGKNSSLTKIFVMNIPSEDFDIDELQNKIRAIRYDESDEEIVLIEGDYLLLKNTNLRALADYTILIKSESQNETEKIISTDEILKINFDGDIIKEK